MAIIGIGNWPTDSILISPFRAGKVLYLGHSRARGYRHLYSGTEAVGGNMANVGVVGLTLRLPRTQIALDGGMYSEIAVSAPPQYSN